jgi:hypothetical protein
VSPFTDVVAVRGSGKRATYSLARDHAERAAKVLLFGKPLGVVSLAAFLYRDYGLSLEAQTSKSLIALFRDEFGFRSTVLAENLAFEKLFVDDSAKFASAGDLFMTTTLK